MNEKPQKRQGWRVGVQSWTTNENGKKVPVWNWSARFNSLEEIQAWMTPWISSNPGCVISYRTETWYE